MAQARTMASGTLHYPIDLEQRIEHDTSTKEDPDLSPNFQ